MDPVLAKVTDAAVLANSPSVHFPDEAIANQATLESAGYVLMGSATNPATFQIAADPTSGDNALQIDVPAAHVVGNYMSGVAIPMAVASGDPFDVVVVFEPPQQIVVPPGTAGSGTLRSPGIAACASGGGFFLTAGLYSAKSVYLYYSTSAGVFATGAFGGTSSTVVDSIAVSALRIARVGSTVYYGALAPRAGGGWGPIIDGSPNIYSDPGWIQAGTDLNNTEMSYIGIGAWHANAEAQRIRVRSIWRLA